jgi:hypothetical protein
VFGSETLSVRITVPEDDVGRVGTITNTTPPDINLTVLGKGIYLVTGTGLTSPECETALNGFLNGGDLEFDPRPCFRRRNHRPSESPSDSPSESPSLSPSCHRRNLHRYRLNILLIRPLSLRPNPHHCRPPIDLRNHYRCRCLKLRLTRPLDLHPKHHL